MSSDEEYDYDLLRRIFQNDAREFLIGKRRLAGDEKERWVSTRTVSEYILTKHGLGDLKIDLFSERYTQHFMKDLQNKGELSGYTKEEAIKKKIFSRDDEVLGRLNKWDKLYKYKKKLDIRK